MLRHSTQDRRALSSAAVGALLAGEGDTRQTVAPALEPDPHGTVMNTLRGALTKLTLIAVLATASTGLTGCAAGALGAGQGIAGLLGLGGAPGAGGTAAQPLGGSLAAGLPGSPGSTATGAANVPAGGNQEQRALAQRYLDRVNQLRAQVGSPAVQFDERLFQGCLARVPAIANGMDNHAGYRGGDGSTGECLAGVPDPAQSADMYFSEGPGGGHYELMFTSRQRFVAFAASGRASVAHSR